MSNKLALIGLMCSCTLLHVIHAQYPNNHGYNTEAVAEQLAHNQRVTPNVPLETHLLNIMRPIILLLEYRNDRTETSYSFTYTTDDGSTRTEEGIRVNPDTPQEELVVMGSYGYRDGDIETVTMYTADKRGYRPRVSIKNRKLNPKLLASLAG